MEREEGGEDRKEARAALKSVFIHRRVYSFRRRRHHALAGDMVMNKAQPQSLPSKSS